MDFHPFSTRDSAHPNQLQLFRLKRKLTLKAQTYQIVDVSCGSNFTLCASSTGDLYGFGPNSLKLGQRSGSNKDDKSDSGSAQASTIASRRLHWAGESERTRRTGRRLEENRENDAVTTKIRLPMDEDEPSPVSFAANGSIGMVWRSEPLCSTSNIKNTTSNVKDKTSNLESTHQTTKSSSSPSDETFEGSKNHIDELTRSYRPRDEVESSLIAQSREAWTRADYLSRMVERAQTRLIEIRHKEQTLEARLLEQELRVESYARTMLEFSDLRGFETIESMVGEAENDGDEGELSEGGRGMFHRRRLGNDTQQHSLSSLSSSQATMVRLKEEDSEVRMRDAIVCRKQLMDALSLLGIVRGDLQSTRDELASAVKEMRDSEISAWEWRTRALLMDRARLRLMRETREKRRKEQQQQQMDDQSVQRGVLLTGYPNEMWGSGRLPRVVLVGGNGPQVARGELEGESQIWVLCRLDPDFGPRIPLAAIRIVLVDGEEDFSKDAIRDLTKRLKGVFVSASSSSPSAPSDPPLAKSRSVVPMKASSPASSSTGQRQRMIEFILQRHAIFEARQQGEDLLFWVGFDFKRQSRSQQSKQRSATAMTTTMMESMLNQKRISIQVEVGNDEQVARRLNEEVDGKGEFFQESRKTEWEELQLAVL